MLAATAANTQPVTEVEADVWRNPWLCRAAMIHPPVTSGERTLVSIAPLQPPPPTFGFLQFTAMAPTVWDSAPSSSRRREPSPVSPAPSLPPSDLSFLQPESPCLSDCKHCDEGTASRHSTMTRSTQLPSCWTLASTVSCFPHSSESLTICRDAQLHPTQPYEAFENDSLKTELLARDVRSRPLGCCLGTSIRPQGTRNSILASAFSLANDDW